MCTVPACLLLARWCTSHLECLLRWQLLPLRLPQQPQLWVLLQLLLLGRAECSQALWPRNWLLRKGLTSHKSLVSAQFHYSVGAEFVTKMVALQRLVFLTQAPTEPKAIVSLICAGSGPDGRVTKKDIENFVPAKAAPVSQMVLAINYTFLSENGKKCLSYLPNYKIHPTEYHHMFTLASNKVISSSSFSLNV